MPDKGHKNLQRPLLRYQEVSDKLLSDIRRGHYPIGKRLPTEIELCSKFNVSRHTVREALRRLDELGVVKRKQGSGTLVNNRDPQSKYTQTLSSIGELLKYPADTSLTIIDKKPIVMGKQLSKKLGCKPHGKWSKIRCIRKTKDGFPISLTNVFVKPKYSNVTDYIGLDDTPVYALIAKHFNQNAGKVEIELFADTISPEGVEYLNVQQNTPALIVIRRYSEPPKGHFEISMIEHPAARFTYTMELEQAWGTGAPLT